MHKKKIDLQYKENEENLIEQINGWINSKTTKDHVSIQFNHMEYSDDFFTNLEKKLNKDGFKCAFEMKPDYSRYKKGIELYYSFVYYTVALPTYKVKSPVSYQDMVKLFNFGGFENTCVQYYINTNGSQIMDKYTFCYKIIN